MFLNYDLNIANMKFTKRPVAISADYRPTFRITLIALALFLCSREKRASLLKLHLFSWAMKSQENMDSILRLLINNNSHSIHSWAIEPSLNRALNLGVSEKVFKKEGKSYLLTKKGIQLAELVMVDSELMDKEKIFLQKVGKSLTEKKVLQISKIG
jgi:hypothetical protein